MRNDEIDAILERTISLERLTKYLDACQGQRADAITLYEENTKLSECFYTPLQCLEVCLRNSIHYEMTNRYGVDWTTNSAPPLLQNSVNAVNEVIDRSDKDPALITAGDIVADSKFSFWVGLLSRRYDNTIWRHCLYRGFRAGQGKTRDQIYKRFNAIRRFRNRVMHHEPIIFKNPNRTHDEIVEALGWMCQDTKAWVEFRSNYIRQ